MCVYIYSLFFVSVYSPSLLFSPSLSLSRILALMHTHAHVRVAHTHTDTHFLLHSVFLLFRLPPPPPPLTHPPHPPLPHLLCLPHFCLFSQHLLLAGRRQFSIRILVNSSPPPPPPNPAPTYPVFQLVEPHFIQSSLTSKLEGVVGLTPSLFYPTSDSFVASALRTIGKETVTVGYWPHEVLVSLVWDLHARRQFSFALRVQFFLSVKSAKCLLKLYQLKLMLDVFFKWV